VSQEKLYVFAFKKIKIIVILFCSHRLNNQQLGHTLHHVTQKVFDLESLNLTGMLLSM
jgi:hypothetical protein